MNPTTERRGVTRKLSDKIELTVNKFKKHHVHRYCLIILVGLLLVGLLLVGLLLVGLLLIGLLLLLVGFLLMRLLILSVLGFLLLVTLISANRPALRVKKALVVQSRPFGFMRGAAPCVACFRTQCRND